MTEAPDLASVTAVALVREAVARRMDPEAYNPGKMVTEYLRKVWEDDGRPEEGLDVGPALGALIGMLVTMVGASVQALICAGAGKPLEDVTDAELHERLDSLEIDLLLRGFGHD